MFGGLGGALKGLSSKAEEMIEKTKTSVGEIAAEKKAAATAMIEAQAKKTGDALFHGMSNAEAGANQAKADAIEGFDKELSAVESQIEQGVQDTKISEESKPAAAASEPAAEPSSNPLGGFDPSSLLSKGSLLPGNLDKEADKVVDQVIQKVNKAADDTLKEADQYLDQKREEVVKVVQDETQKVSSGATEGLNSMLGKAKGLLPF